MADAPELTTTLVEDRPGKLERAETSLALAPEFTAELKATDLPVIPRAHYDFGREIARGGLGRIQQARDRRLNRLVAIKELLNPTPSSRARFLREIEITARLEHPSIVTIHEAGHWPDGQLFYAMNFVAGEMLLNTMNRAATAESRLALLPHIVAISEAVAYAHSQGVVHRDLKPANVLVGQFGETVVIDWGLAKFAQGPSLAATQPIARQAELDEPLQPLSRHLTREGGVVGTPPYMAPEQARGAEVDATADVYAIGAILYQTLCGTEPYAGFEDARLLREIAHRPPASLQGLVPDLPPDLLAIVNKAMHRDPEQRYAHAGEMARELQRFSTGRLVSAYSYSPWDLLSRFARRHAAALGTALVAAALLALLAITLVRQIQAERDTATHHAQVAIQERDTAERRAEELIVSEARALQNMDPTLAANQLKRLKPGSQPSGTLSVLLGAEEEGVARWVLKGHTDAVRCLDFSPDSASLLSGGDDKSLRVWPLSAGPSRRAQYHTDRVSTCAFVNRGKQVASGGYDTRLIVSDTSFKTHRVLGTHESAIKALKYSDQSQQLATASSEAVRLWSLTNPQSQELRTTNPRWPALEFSSSGGALLSGGHLGRLQRWRLGASGYGSLEESPSSQSVVAGLWLGAGGVLLANQQGELTRWNDDGALEPLARLPNKASTLARTPEGLDPPRVFAAGEDGRVWQVDLTSGETSVLYRHGQAVEVLKVSGDGRYLASAGLDKVVRLIDLESSAVRQFKGHTDVVSALAFSADGKWLASASWDTTIRIWQLESELHTRRRVVHAHDVGVHAARFSHDGRLFASGGHDDHVKVWSTTSGASITLNGHTDHVYRVIFSPKDRYIATSSDDRTVRVWPVPELDSRGRFVEGSGAAPLVLEGHRADVEEIAFSPNGDTLVSGAEDRSARLWRLSDAGFRELSHDGNVTQVLFNATGTRFATASLAGDVRVFDAAGGNLAVFRDHGGREVHALRFTPRGDLVSVDTSGALVIRNPELGNKRSHPGFGGARILAFSPDGNWFALNGSRPHLWLCPFRIAVLEDPKPPLLEQCRDLNAHLSQINRVQFTPDSSHLVGAGSNGVVTLWNVKNAEFRQYLGHEAPVYDLDISSDGRFILSASSDETVRLWPLVAVPAEPDFPALFANITELRTE